MTYAVDGATAKACPTAQQFREVLAARMGYDPIVAEAKWTVAVVVAATDGGLNGEWRLTTDAQTAKVRAFSAGPTECDELVESLALSVSVAIDKFVAERAAQQDEQPDPPVPAAARPVEPEISPFDPPKALTARPEPKAKPPPRLLASLRVHGSFGTSPGFTGGAALGIGVRLPSFSVAVEGRADVPTTEEADDRTGVRGTFLGAGLVPCAELDAVHLCGLAMLGALRGEGVNVPTELRDTTLYPALGARIGYGFAVTPRVDIAVQLDGWAPLNRTTLEVVNGASWSTPAVGVALGLGVRGTIF